MRVVFLLQDRRSLYGAEQATIQLVSGLSAAGVEVRVILLREVRLGPGDSPLAAAFRSVVPVEEMPVEGRLSRSAVKGIRRLMQEWGADVLHSTGYKADVHAGLAAKWGRLFPIVATVHGWLFRWRFKERLFQWLDIRALRRFSRVLVMSGFYEQYLRRRGFHPLQLARIPIGVKAEELAPRREARRLWESPDAVFTFGMLGRLSEEKNHGLLLKAAVRLRRDMDASPRPWRIVIAGEGPLRKQLKRRIRQLQLEDRVQLAGHLGSAEFFRRVHVLVQCSKVENQPMSVMESMAWMRPAVVTRAGGLPELVEDGETGLIVPAGSSRGLAAAMKDCLIAPAKAQAAGLRARARVEEHYSYETMIRDHIGVYEAAWVEADRRL